MSLIVSRGKVNDVGVHLFGLRSITARLQGMHERLPSLQVITVPALAFKDIIPHPILIVVNSGNFWAHQSSTHSTR